MPPLKGKHNSTSPQENLTEPRLKKKQQRMVACRSFTFHLFSLQKPSPRAAGRVPAHLLVPRSEVKKGPPSLFPVRRGPRPPQPRHRNSKTGTLCSGMWLRFKDWYLQREAEICFKRTCGGGLFLCLSDSYHSELLW